MSRNKLILNEYEFETLGFERNHNGGDDDPRNYWWELTLSNRESNNDTKIVLCCDAYFDFIIEISPADENTIELNLNFQNIEEIKVFSMVFKREFNHAFAGLLDICNKA